MLSGTLQHLSRPVRMSQRMSTATGTRTDTHRHRDPAYRRFVPSILWDMDVLAYDPADPLTPPSLMAMAPWPCMYPIGC